VTESSDRGRIDPTSGLLAERAIEVLITHNEPVSRDDLACALNVTGSRMWGIATRLRALGYATLDESKGTIEATALAAEPIDQQRRDQLLRALEED
jgi:hypothetical protein